MTAANATDCPTWCNRKRHEDARFDDHATEPRHAEDIAVMLVQDIGWDQPRLWVGAGGRWQDSAFIAIGEAPGFAAVLDRLGHTELAGLIASTAALGGAG